MALAFLALAFVFALAGAVRWPQHPRVDFGWLGVAFYFAYLLLIPFGRL
jgi:hypothetical protein